MEGNELGMGSVRFHNEKTEGGSPRNFTNYSEEN